MPTWIKSSPQQSVAALNPTISTKAPNVIDTEVTGLLMKGAIYEVGRVQGEYVSYSLQYLNLREVLTSGGRS